MALVDGDVVRGLGGLPPGGGVVVDEEEDVEHPEIVENPAPEVEFSNDLIQKAMEAPFTDVSSTTDGQANREASSREFFANNLSPPEGDDALRSSPSCSACRVRDLEQYIGIQQPYSQDPTPTIEPFTPSKIKSATNVNSNSHANRDTAGA